MRTGLQAIGGSVLFTLVAGGPALAHHAMGGELPTTAFHGVMSGLAHPIIGIDHLAAVVAVGCLAALHRRGALLALTYVLAMVGGAAIVTRGFSLPAGEILVALSVLVLGIWLVWRQAVSTAEGVLLFAPVGLVHGIALGQSIIGAEPTPIYAYLTGLLASQGVLILAVMALARLAFERAGEVAPMRLVGACIFGIGLAVLASQLVPAS